jgi:uncharacterized membrane protein
MVGKWLARGYDLLILSFVVVWLAGGISWNSHLYLKHGADSRRAAILVGLGGYFLVWVFQPALRLTFQKDSWVLSGVLKFGEKLREKRFRWWFYLSFIAVAAVLAVMQTLAMRVPLYDVGIFHQILWSLSSGEGFHSTISRAGNFLQDHFSPTLALLAPLFQFSQDTVFFLPVMQVLLILGGASAWIYLAEKVSEKRPGLGSHLPAAVVIFIFGFESLWANLRWGFHENALAFLALSWGFALLFTVDFQTDSVDSWYRRVGALCLLSVAAFSKEIILVDVSFVMVIWVGVELFKNRGLKSKDPSWRWFSQFFTWILALLALGFIWQFVRFESMEHPADKNYFDRYYSYLGHDVSSFFSNLLQFPSLIVTNIGASELLRYLFTVFLPWLFLPFAFFFFRGLKRQGFQSEKKNRNWSFVIWLVAMLPSFGSAALSTYSPLRSPQFHYVLELWPILACLTVVALGSIEKKNWIWAWALFSIFRWDTDPISQFLEYKVQMENQQEFRAVLKQLPEAASVMADDLAGPWVSGRKWVARWPDAALLPGQCPDYWVIQVSQSRPNEGQDRILNQFGSCFSVGQTLEELYRSPSWSVFRRVRL